jgi:SAM-dependent methyltransferase
MRSDEGRFWDERFRREGFIWGEGPSPTAKTAARHLPANARVLEVGFGYGRDLAFLLRQGYRVSGIDLSVEARGRAEARLRRAGLAAERLVTGSFADSDFAEGLFDGVLSHRMAHLLVTAEAVERFVDQLRRVLRPGGLVCLAVRNADDRDPAEVRPVGENVGEYLPRPGHWIRYWDDEALRQAFGKAFTFLALERVCENESLGRPVPCHLTVLVGRKTADVGAGGHGVARPGLAGGSQIRGAMCGTQP